MCIILSFHGFVVVSCACNVCIILSFRGFVLLRHSICILCKECSFIVVFCFFMEWEFVVNVNVCEVSSFALCVVTEVEVFST